MNVTLHQMLTQGAISIFLKSSFIIAGECGIMCVSMHAVTDTGGQSMGSEE